MLWSPSCSASLSERFAPLRAETTGQKDFRYSLHIYTSASVAPSVWALLHQQLTDVLKLAHVGKLLLHQLLDSSAHADGDDLQGAAEGGQHRLGSRWCLKTTDLGSLSGGSSVRLLWTYITGQSCHDLSSCEPSKDCFPLIWPEDNNHFFNFAANLRLY